MESDPLSSQLLIFSGIGALLMIALALLVIVLSNRVQKRLLQQQMQQQELKLKHQQELLQHNLRIQEEERQRIAEQLHDDIGSKLGVINLTFHRLRRNSVHPNTGTDVVYDEISDLINLTMETTRRISHELLPPTLENFGIVEAINEFMEGVRKTGAVQVHFEHDLERSQLGNANQELQLFRILQELTSNTLKYATAKNIRVSIFKSNNTITFNYEDDGVGYDMHLNPSKGLGLRNIENRAQMMDGDLNMYSQVGNGFKAKITFELALEQQPNNNV
jgi:two-component system, NarL family, sensor kinase